MDEWKHVDKALQFYADDLQDHLPIEDLLHNMKSENLISENEYREINTMRSRREKNGRICKILKSKKDSQDFILFCKLLCMHPDGKLNDCGWMLREIAITGG